MTVLAGRRGGLANKAQRPAASSRPWAMVGSLTLFAMLAAIDKNFLTLVVSDIKTDFTLTDVQIGLVMGLAFAVSNVAVSLPAGWLADHADRRMVVAGGVALWSVMAATCGLSQSYLQLFAARVGVGLGEGLSPPASYSLINDGAPVHRRGLSYSVFAVGTLLGSGFAFVVGGMLIRAVKALDLAGSPVFGGAPTWRIALALIGAAGLPISLLAFSFPEPGRKSSDREGRASVAQVLATVRRRWRVLAALLVFSVLHALITSGFAAWVPGMLQRTYGATPGEFGPVLGLVLMVGAPVGLITAGLAIDRLGRIGPAVAAIAASVLLIVGGSAAPHADSLFSYWRWQILIAMGAAVYLPVVSCVVSRAMPASMTGSVMAAFLFLQAIAGAGCGPLVVALIAEHAFGGGPGAINWAISWVSMSFGAVSLAAAIALAIALRRPAAG